MSFLSHKGQSLPFWPSRVTNNHTCCLLFSFIFEETRNYTLKLLFAIEFKLSVFLKKIILLLHN
jgi:hypothetical protein